jgi:cell division transport system permease protein
MTTTLTVLVIGIALALPACLQVLIANARAASGDLNRAVDLSVYLKPNSAVAQAEQVAAAIRSRHTVASARLIKAEDALRDFREHSGFGEALDALNENPLPHSIVVTPAANRSSSGDLESLAQEIRGIDGVELVQLDTAWVERFNAMLDALRRGVLIIALLLGFGVLIIVGNTIRADIQARRAEIEVAKLVGATDAFVRRPFLYTGAWYGLGGGVIAVAVSFAVVALLAGPVQRLAGLYGSDFRLSGLGAPDAFTVIGVGVALGWLGSLVAASRHLREIEPQ